jgi:uncharacterized protein
MLRFFALSLLLIASTGWSFGSPKLKISSGSLTGVYFPISSSIAKIIERNRGYETTVLQSSGSIDNINRLLKGESALVLAAADNLYTAYHQKPPFQNLTTGNTLRVIASIYPELLHIVVHKNCVKSTRHKFLMPGILRRCTLNLGPQNSGTLEHAQMILDEMKFDPKGYGKFDFETATEKILAGELDGGFFTLGRQSLTIKTLMNTGDYILVSLLSSVTKKVHLKFPFFSKHMIPYGTYQNQKYKVWTLAVYAQLAATNALSDTLAKEVIETMVAEIHELRSAHECGMDFSLQTALEGVNIPVHNGAKQFYVNQGILSPILNQH